MAAREMNTTLKDPRDTEDSVAVHEATENTCIRKNTCGSRAQTAIDSERSKVGLSQISELPPPSPIHEAHIIAKHATFMLSDEFSAVCIAPVEEAKLCRALELIPVCRDLL
jgi:hypothetical protein